jgi:hypothetical protein
VVVTVAVGLVVTVAVTLTAGLANCVTVTAGLADCVTVTVGVAVATVFVLDPDDALPIPTPMSSAATAPPMVSQVRSLFLGGGDGPPEPCGRGG